MTDITIEDLSELIGEFAKSSAYRAKDPDSKLQAFMQRCILLANLDYVHTIVNNHCGELSAHYPSHLIVLENEKSHNQNDLPPSTHPSPPQAPPKKTTETIYESVNEGKKLEDIIRKARFARCRSRFPLPVILYKGKYICRSATLSSGPEIYGRHGLLYIFGSPESNDIINDVTSTEVDKADIHLNEWQLYDKVRQCDIQLLKALNVGTIIDFMVEKKKVKFGMNVTSSEKVDKEKRYAEFRIIPLPYPGCEFFREFRENDYLAGGLFFNWAQNHVDAEICVPTDSIATSLGISWDSYRNWDLVNLTQNYLKLILRYLHDSNTGLLVHCISGWDRTPLFISLLRISLWADGVIHTSLNASQMLYYTVAYDWMLFGHDLQDRLAKGEDIFYFCFYFLKHILSEDFSVSSKARHVSRNDSDSQLDNVMFDNEFIPPLSSVSSNLSLNSCCSNNSQNSRDSQDNNPPAVFHCAIIDDKEDAQSNGNIPQNHCNNVHWSSSPNKDTLTSAAAMAAASGIASAPATTTALTSASSTSASTTATANHGGTRSPLPMANRTSPVAVPVPGRMRQRNESSSSGGSWQMISTTGSLRGTTSAGAVGMFDTLSANNVTTSQESNTTLIDDESLIVNPATQRADRLTSLRNKFYKVYTTTVGLRLKDQSDCGIGQMIGNLAEKVLSIQRNSSSGT